MLFDIPFDAIKSGLSPQQLPNWLVPRDEGLDVAGDRVSLRETFVWCSDDRVLVATTLEELLPSVTAESADLTVSPLGISHMLNHGFVPIPHTVYEGVRRLGPGDTLRFAVDGDGVSASLASSYPWLSDLSREDEVPSTSRLRELIASALDDQLNAAGGTGFLMLSSGKDSVVLALALADGGHTQVPCFTFKSGPGDTEHLYAAELCERLGLEHHTVEMPDDPATTKAALLHFFEHSPLPSVDLATIPYVIVAHTAGFDHGGIIDGSGNDTYMGYLLSSRGRIKHSLRIRNRHLARLTTKVVPHDSPVNYFARGRVGTFLPGRMFRDRETRSFFADAEEIDEYWYDTDRDDGALGLHDFVGVAQMRHKDTARSNSKVYLVARARGLEPLLPFCDERIADYYFNLPEAGRFDRSARANKILLRRLLAETLDYDAKVVGSNFFGFDGASFLIENERFVRDEILSCDLWLPDIEPMLDGWMRALPKRPFLYHSLVALFMVSGWHNHCSFIERKQGVMSGGV